MAAPDEQPEGTPVYTDVPPEPAAATAPAAEVTPPATDIPTQVISPGGGENRLPLKKILLGVGAALAVLALLFGVWQILARTILKKPPEAKITLTWWGLWEDKNVIEPAIRDYETKNPNVKINYLKQAKEDYRERLTSSLARGDGPDIFRFHNTWVPMLAANLSPVSSAVFDAAGYQQTFYPVAAETLRSGANLVGLPLMFDGLGLFINEEIFAAAGKNPPKTWDELRELAQELTVRDQNVRIQQAGVALGRTDNVDHWQDILSLMMLQNGADLANPTGKLAEDALSFFTVFSTNDGVWDETLPPSTQAFAAGKLAMYLGPSWRAHEIKKISPSLKFRVAAVPQLPKSKPGEPDINWASFWAEGVASKSKNRDEAWKFLGFLVNRENLQKMYQEAAKTRTFGEPYPRVDMAALVSSDPYVGAFISQAPAAKSWYLTSRTFDGPTGINSRLSAYFEDAVNAVVKDGKEPADVLPTVAQGVSQVLSSYNLSR